MHNMDDPDGDAFADLDAEMDAVGDSPPDAEMPVPMAVQIPVAVPVPVALPLPVSLFNYGAAPTAITILMETKNGNVAKTPKTSKVNDIIDASEFVAYALDFERHGSPAGLK